MVDSRSLDRTFRALADPTRRHIIGMLVEQKQHRLTELAAPFEMSFAAVSKHVKVLERAALVTRTRRGREFYLQLNTSALQVAKDWIEFYEQFWMARFASLEQLLADDLTKPKEQ